MNLTPEQLGQIGDLLRGLGNHIQRTYPRAGREGSQEHEDRILGDLFPEANGVYVDIGAADPVDNSNTWQFYKRGWRGLLVEPVPSFYPRILRQRPRDQLWPTAVGDYAGYSHMRICGQVSSLRNDWVMEERNEGIVEVMPTREILANFPDIRDNCSLCSIDVEGFEKAVLEGIDWNLFHPRVVCVEYVVHSDTSSEWESILNRNGYNRWAKTGCNYIYRR